MSTKKTDGVQLQAWRLWLLLAVSIQLTVWVRRYRYAEYYEKDKDQPDNVVSAVEADGNDSCNGYSTCGSCTYSRFKYLSSPSPTLQGGSQCHWCSLSDTCYSPSHQPKDYCTDPSTNASIGVNYQYDCPLGPTPYPQHPPTLLPNWMGEFYKAGILEHVRLMDLSLPGTHDSLSYDLSLTVSEDGIDSLKELAKLLHTLSGGTVKILPGDLEEFFRMQAKTQQLTLTQQLDNGVRFLDIRIMWEPDKNAWYSIHFMQSKKPAEEYIKEIRQWLDAHPQEVVVIWLSKHGSPGATGGDQYPGVSPSQKKQFWDKYCAIFDGLLQVTNETSIFHTPMATLIEKNHRVISYVSDYLEFTQSSPLAENAAFIQNSYDSGDGIFKGENLLQGHIDYFRNASVNNHLINKAHGFTLLAMNTASPSWQVISTAKNQFLHWLRDHQNEKGSYTKSHNQKRKLGRRHLLGHYKPKMQDTFRLMAWVNASPLWRVVSDLSEQVSSWTETSVREKKKQASQLNADLFKSCSSHIKIPGVDHWCPKNLMDIAQLSSYYNQIAIEEAYQNSYAEDGNSTRVLAGFPNAFYLDGLDYDGTLRIGPQLLDGSERGDMSNNVDTKHSKYALVDTILAYNTRLACARRTTDSQGCDALMDRIYERKSRNRLQRWSEPDLGRHRDWPSYSYESHIRHGHSGVHIGKII